MKNKTSQTNEIRMPDFTNAEIGDKVWGIFPYNGEYNTHEGYITNIIKDSEYPIRVKFNDADFNASYTYNYTTYGYGYDGRRFTWNRVPTLFWAEPILVKIIPEEAYNKHNE